MPHSKQCCIMTFPLLSGILSGAIVMSTAPPLSPRALQSTCLPKVQVIKLQSTTSQEIGIFEVSAIDSMGNNVATGGIATQSSVRESYSASFAIDGDSSTYSRTAFGDGEAWWQVRLNSESELSRIFIQNRWCDNSSDPQSCLCQLSHASLLFLDKYGAEVYSEDLGDTCGQVEVQSGYGPDAKFCLEKSVVGRRVNDVEVVANDFGSVFDAIDNVTAAADVAVDANAALASASSEASTASKTTMNHTKSQDLSNTVNLSKNEIFALVQLLRKEDIPHQCNVAVTRDIKASDNFEQHPVVFCNFNVPIGLPCTAEIQPTTCDHFKSVSSGEFYSRGIASAIFIPDITEADRQVDVYDSSYCARIDVYYHEEPIFDKTFPVNITYRNYESDGKYGMSATISEAESTSTKWDANSIGLGLGCGFLGGSIVTLAMVAMLKEKKKRPKSIESPKNTVEGTEEHELL
ncbi:hypothetical protein ACHAW6_005513 [Cyclotella cf. meneghiniana]